MDTDTFGSIVCETLHSNTGEAMRDALDACPNGGLPDNGDPRLGGRNIFASYTNTVLQSDRSEDAYTVAVAEMVSGSGVVPFILASNANIVFSTAQAATKDPSNFFCLREYAAPLFDGDAS